MPVIRDSLLPTYVQELEKEEDAQYKTQFERDAARFRRQTRRSEPIPSDVVIEDIPETEAKTNMGPSYRSELFKEDPSLVQPKYENEVGQPTIWMQIGVRFLAT